LKLCIFEDGKYGNLYPLAYTRPVFDLRCGRTRIYEKIKRSYPDANVVYFMRSYLEPVFKARLDGEINKMEALKGDDVLFVNGRLLAWAGTLKPLGDEFVAVKGEDVVYARAKRESVEGAASRSLEEVLQKLRARLGSVEIEADLVEYPWHLVKHNARAINDDFQFLTRKGVFGRMSAKAEICGGEDRVYIADTAEIHPFVVLDASGGPIIIDGQVKVFPFSRIEGPCSIGSGTMILRGNIREEVSIGPVCRVGGEVEASIIHGYSNKYHTGFLGHAYVGEWVNIGALSTNSDLKNDYSNVEVYVNGKMVDSGDSKVGCFVGDHTKFGIGCLLNTGTVVGVCCSLLGGDVPPKYIPSFTWFVRGRISRGSGFRRTMQAEKRVMNRRGVEMSQSYFEMMQHVYDETKKEREDIITRAKGMAATEA
jgi:UDP-N-acetylglucosamine diphosphorylase/glucosamine-1-phosphate N-acetyltransferase